MSKNNEVEQTYVTKPGTGRLTWPMPKMLKIK